MERSSEVDFSLGFNDADLSDRVLRLEITRLEITRPPSKLFSKFGENSNVQVKTLNICSLILAAKSPFFYKLLKNGMKESQKKKDRGVTVKIHHSDECAFMDLLSFIYDKPMNATLEADLLEVLMAANKFEVPSCVRHCRELLLQFPLTTESAVHYIELSSTAFIPIIDPLFDEAKKFLASQFRNFTKSQQHVAMELPLSAVEVVLTSDGLRVDAEDVIFDFVLRWARKHYTKLVERRDILTNRMARLICFQNMSVSKLKANLECPDFDGARMSKLVVSALFSKVEALNKPTFPRRDYNYRLVKVVHLKLSQPHCVVYFDIKIEECANTGILYSQAFLVGGESFYLHAQSRPEQHAFALYLCRSEAGSESCTLDYQFYAMKKPNKEFTSLWKSQNVVLLRSKGWGRTELLKTPGKDFVSQENEYFIDGILHFRVDIALIN